MERKTPEMIPNKWEYRNNSECNVNYKKLLNARHGQGVWVFQYCVRGTLYLDRRKKNNLVLYSLLYLENMDS